MTEVLSDSDNPDSPWRKFKGKRTLPSGPWQPKGHKENFDRNTQSSKHSNRKKRYDNWSSRLEKSNYWILEEPHHYNRVRINKVKNLNSQVYSYRWCFVQKIIQSSLPSVSRTGGNPICLKRNPRRHLWPTYGRSVPLLQSTKARILLANNKKRLGQFCSKVW